MRNAFLFVSSEFSSKNLKRFNECLYDMINNNMYFNRTFYYNQIIKSPENPNTLNQIFIFHISRKSSLIFYYRNRIISPQNFSLAHDFPKPRATLNPARRAAGGESIPETVFDHPRVRRGRAAPPRMRRAARATTHTSPSRKRQQIF